MRARLVKSFTFESAHRLPHVPEGHKCFRLHGHRYRAEVIIEGEVDPHTGWVIDFDEMAQVLDPVRDALDHHYLNEVEGLENPTAEHIARWIWDRAVGTLPLLEVRVEESPDASCRYYGDA